MKKIILIFSILVYGSCILAQQPENYFSLSLELVKHNGIIDSESYFKATLKSRSELNLFVFSDKFPSNITPLSIFTIERELNNGGYVETDNRYPFFAHYYEEKIIVIPPKSSIVVKFPLFAEKVETGAGQVPGFFALTLENTKKYKKVRIKLYNLYYGNKAKSKNEMPIGGIIPLITSNWVDISNEDISKAFE